MLQRAVAILLAVIACASAWAGNATSEVCLATTTSVENSGLLGHLLPQFERSTGIRILVLPVGSGQALELAARGDVDVVLSHSPEQEEEALARGTVIEPRVVMENEFFLVGPASDPAHVRGFTDIAKAMAAIASQQRPFVSRGDRSGTHAMEVQLWKKMGVSPVTPWYWETGQGMGATLVTAKERGAYTLTDRATFATFRSREGLEVLVRDDPPLKNVYRVFLAQPSKRPQASWEAARQFALWLVSPAGQAAIASFRPFGEPLFVPAARSDSP
ncbi:MAG: ABC transporter substrate-binding protein [Candidatus Binatia bacterium]|nr:MAG: ABC transporter substrate-binding protein [Candidatus Binatia bacterium]